MKNEHIKKYWKEERESASTQPVVKAVEEAPFVEHAGGTKSSIQAYRQQKCMQVCGRWG